LAKGTGSGELHGAMAFNRKDYGMDKGIPFIKIAHHLDVNFHPSGNTSTSTSLSEHTRTAVVEEYVDDDTSSRVREQKSLNFC
jgi:hypothetical protein